MQIYFNKYANKVEDLKRKREKKKVNINVK